MSSLLSPPFAVHLNPVLEPVSVPDTSGYWPAIGAFLHTGEPAREHMRNLLSMAPQRIAIDLETRGTDAGRWSATCATVAFRGTDGAVHSALLDPLRRDDDRALLYEATRHASSIVFHNGTFDVPIMYVHGWIEYADVRKYEDTILLARMVDTHTLQGRDLESLAKKYHLLSGESVSILKMFHAAGYANSNEGYSNGDIHLPGYRYGALHDTAITLRLWDALYERVVNHLTVGAPGSTPASRFPSRNDSIKLINDIHRVGAITLQSACRGLLADMEYIDSWMEATAPRMERAARVLAANGINPGNGAHLVDRLGMLNYLPADWPTTASGAPSSAKGHLAEFVKTQNRPLVRAHRLYAELGKTWNYLATIKEYASATGRVHAAVNVLGAQATGRMSYSSPALQQFNAEARPALRSDIGTEWYSIDWASIEPVVMANCAGDRKFIEPFNNGADLYVPVARAAGLIPPGLSDEAAAKHPGRKHAKVVLLATMYGEGVKKLAADLKVTVAEAQVLKGKLRASMEKTYSFMDSITTMSEDAGFISTISGRVLNETMENGDSMSYRSVNHFCQGSAADMLLAVTLQLDDMGAADAIKLWVHDELVVDSEHLDAVKEAMAMTPQWLRDAASRHDMTPVIRIDAAPLGTNWQKV